MPTNNLPNEVEIIELSSFSDPRGKLVPIEFQKVIPFEVKRIFVVTNVPINEKRGAHAHKKCKQFFVCLAGSLDILLDDGSHHDIINLREGGPGIYVPEMTWGSQFNYSSGAILLVLASHIFDQQDYIHDYNEFLSQKQ